MALDLLSQFQSPFDKPPPQPGITPLPQALGAGGNMAAMIQMLLPYLQQEQAARAQAPANLVQALQNLRGGGHRDSLTGAIMPADPLEAQRIHDQYFQNQFRSTPQRIAREREVFQTPADIPTFTEQELAGVNARARNRLQPRSPAAPAPTELQGPAPVDITHPTLGVNANMFPTRPDRIPTPTVGLANREMNQPKPSTTPQGGYAGTTPNPSATSVPQGTPAGTAGGPAGGFPEVGVPSTSPEVSNLGYPGSPMSYPPSVANLPAIPQLRPPAFTPPGPGYQPGAGFARQMQGPIQPPPVAQQPPPAAAPQAATPNFDFNMPRGETTITPGVMMPRANPDVIPEFAGQYAPGAAFPRQMRPPAAPQPSFWDAMRQMFAIPPAINPMLIR